MRHRRGVYPFGDRSGLRNTITLKFKSEEGKEYTITYSPDLSPGSWKIAGTTALFNGIEVTAEGLDRYFYTATSSTTIVEITFTEGAPERAFFKGAEFVSFCSYF